jgi:PilZ domain-containing protein
LSTNRRSATRHDVVIAGRLVLPGAQAAAAGSDEAFDVDLVNLSLGGAFVEFSRRMPLGARVELQFSIPTQEPKVVVAATVRWSTESGIGVQFDGLRARDVYALTKYFEMLG